jgi:Ca-activated chloride channel family protein
MKNLAITGVVATALTLLVSPAFASGWIVVDPITPVPIRPVHPIHPPGGVIVHPIGNPMPPAPPGHPVLHGSVSFGLHLQSEAVKVDINGPVARTYITQTFSNDSDNNLAGTYLFPLPDDTTFSSFSLHIDGKPVEGKILEAQEARTQYENIVRSMVDPGLLEYADYKTVRARVFPIPAHGTKKIELEYTQALKAQDGLYKYKFPLKAEENAEPADEIKIDMKLSSNQGLRTIWSPTHTVASKRDGNYKASISYDEKDVLPDKDFYLYYSVSDKEMAADMMAQKLSDEQGYFLLSLTPPVEAKAVDEKDIVLVADTSGSMAGDKMEECKKALKYVIKALNPGDKFGIVQFNTDVEPFKSELVAATAENKKAAMSFIDDLEARGGTNISDALKTGSKMLGTDAAGRPAYVVLMTDGEPTVGETSIDKLVQLNSKRDVRLFDFGVGYDVNTKLLNKLAEGHHGAAQYVEPNENLETALSGFYQKIKSPVLSNVNIAYDGIEVKDVYPKEVKDIFAGSQVLLIGRYKNGGNAKVKITGTLDGKSKSFTFPVKFPSEETGHTYLSRLWAMRRIGYLTDVAQANGQSQEVVDEIIALSKKYGIISQYTSFLVTDPSEVHGSAMIRPMPVRRMNVVGNRFNFAPNSWIATHAAARGGGAGSGGYAPVTMRMGATEASGMPVTTLASPMAAPTAVHGKLMQASGDNRVAWYAAPKEVQILDDRAVVRDYREPVGKDAVVRAKKASVLMNSDAIASVDKEQASAGIKGSVKSVEDKTFYFRDGFWTDSDFDASKLKPELVEFGSKKYFDLVASSPELRRYFSAAANLVVVYKGHCYKVVQAATTTG